MRRGVNNLSGDDACRFADEGIEEILLIFFLFSA